MGSSKGIHSHSRVYPWALYPILWEPWARRVQWSSVTEDSLSPPAPGFLLSFLKQVPRL